MKLKEKVVLITGAARGIGRAAAIKCAREGAKLSLVDRNEEGLAQTSQLVRQQNPGADVYVIAADVTREADVRKYVDLTADRYGRIDGFFNNAGIEGPASPSADYDFADFQKVVAVDLFGVFLGIKYVIGIMKKQGSGSIVNTSSIGGIGALENSSPYVASKHGVIGLTRNAAVEYGGAGIRVNAICPGFINTDMLRNVAAKQSPDNPQVFFDGVTAGIPLARLGEAEEVADLVSFLLSDEAKYVSGTAIPIDGAYTAK